MKRASEVADKWRDTKPNDLGWVGKVGLRYTDDLCKDFQRRARMEMADIRRILSARDSAA